MAFLALSDAIWNWAGSGRMSGASRAVEQGGLVLFGRRLVEPGAHVGEGVDEDRCGRVVETECHVLTPIG